MTIADNDVVRVTAALKRGLTDDVQNVFYAKLINGGALSQQDLADDLAEWMESIYDSLEGSLYTDMTFDEIQLFNMTQGTPEPTQAWPTLVAGTSGNDGLSDGVAALVLGRTAVSKVIGKKYFGIFNEAAIADSLWVAATLSQLALAGADWIEPFTGTLTSTWDPVVWRRASSTSEVFTEAVVQGVSAYQRRRKRGVGS